MKEIVGILGDKVDRYKERNSALNYQYVFSDSIDFVSSEDWDKIAVSNTIFLSRKYLRALENCSPENTLQRYVMAYSNKKPVLILACQVAEIGGDRLINTDAQLESLVSKYNERVLVCGNLVSSGLHGVAFANDLDIEIGWRITAEALYKIRRSEKISGQIDFVLVKDIKGSALQSSSVLERYSYRKIQTDPDMVLDFGGFLPNFNAYLELLTSKYRARVKKVAKSIDEAGLVCKKIEVDDQVDARLHALYLQVEEKSKTRLATLPIGYFGQLAKELGPDFVCYGIYRDTLILGFVSLFKDGDAAVAYYVGFDYVENESHPLYFRLLQLVIEAAIELNCSKVHFGRTASEPKASLGAKPVDSYVWARHRVPVVNYFVRKLFRNVPFEEAPERGAMKDV